MDTVAIGIAPAAFRFEVDLTSGDAGLDKGAFNAASMSAW